MLPCMYRCCSGITRDCPRDAQMLFSASRCCPRIVIYHPGCPDVAPGCPYVALYVQMLLHDSQRSHRVMRCWSGCPDVAPGVQMLRQHTQISSRMLTCHPRVPRFYPRILRYRSGCPDVVMGAVVLPCMYRCCSSILRYHPGCPDVAPGGQTLPQAALLSPLGAQLSHLGSGSHWQRCCHPGESHHLQLQFPLPVLQVLVPSAQPDLGCPPQPTRHCGFLQEAMPGCGK